MGIIDRGQTPIYVSMFVNMTYASTFVNVLLRVCYTAHMGTKVVSTCCAPVLYDELGQDEAQALAERFKAIADPVRLQILNRLSSAADGVCVCDIVDGMDKSQPTISHHLKILANVGLVTREKRGRWAWYHLEAAELDGLRKALAGTDAT